MIEITAGAPAARSSTPTACGTTPRASATGTRSGPSTASASSPARRRCGSTRPARGCPCRCSPASTRSARSPTSCATGHEHTWFVLTQKIIEKEFALSGSEQNPDITGKSIRELLKTRVGSGAPPPVEAFKRHGADFVVARRPAHARRRHEPPDRRRRCWTSRRVEAEVVARDRELDNPYTKDLQVTAIHGARRYLSRPHHARRRRRTGCSTPQAGPLIAVKLHILTRKTLGGLHTDLSSARAARRRRAVARPVRRGRGRRASAAAGCTATARSRAPSSAAACSRAAPPGGPSPGVYDEPPLQEGQTSYTPRPRRRPARPAPRRPLDGVALDRVNVSVLL